MGDETHVCREGERGMSPENLVSITSAVAGMWLPIALGIAHDEVCDLLPLSAQDRLELEDESVRACSPTTLGHQVSWA